MTVPLWRLPLLALAMAGVAAASACGGGAGQANAPASTASASPVAAQTQSPQSTTLLVVPAGEGGGALSVTHTLTVPSGWTASVWARVPDARIEAWTPPGDLLVSEPNDGKVLSLRPGSGGTATVTTLLSGLTNPQGLAFATVHGAEVLYVAESDEIDRYPWGPHGIAGRRTVIAANLPDADPSGDDNHRVKD